MFSPDSGNAAFAIQVSTYQSTLRVLREAQVPTKRGYVKVFGAEDILLSPQI